MNDQRTRITDVGEMREQFHVGHQLYARIIATFQAKGEHCTRTFWRIFLLQGMVLVILQARVVDPGDLVILRQPRRHVQRIVAMLLHAQSQRFHARQDQEGIQWGNRWAKVTQAQHTAGDGKGNAAKCFMQLHAVIAAFGSDSRG